MLSEPANLNHARTLNASRVYQPHVSHAFVNLRTTVNYNSAHPLTKSPVFRVNDIFLDRSASQLTAMY